MSVNTVNSVSSSERLALVLFGSPHKNGHTAKLLSAFLEGKPDSVKVAVIDAYREKAHPCTGCGKCREEDVCRFGDLERLDRLFRAADYLIVAAPVYNLSFPAPLKAIFDRTQRYYSARFFRGVKPPVERPKRAALLLCGGSESTEGPQIICRQLSVMFTVLNTTLSEEVFWLSTDSAASQLPKESAHDAAHRFFGEALSD